jgi:hypothetical protein
MHWAVAKKPSASGNWKLHSDSLNETRCGLVGNLLMCRKFAALLLFDIFGMFGAC